MFTRANHLKGYKLSGLDGEIGHVKEFYFDDEHWTIRYLVADTGTWLTGRQVLISPYALHSILGPKGGIAVNLSKKQIEESPSLSTDEPVSRQFEDSYYTFYGWPSYYAGSYMWGAYPMLMSNANPMPNPQMPGEENLDGRLSDSHLRSTLDVSGHRVQASDGEIGHIEDFIIDDSSWAIRYLVVDTKNFWPGKRVLISPTWVDMISWDERKVFVNLTREEIQNAPEYSGDELLSRQYEIGLHEHYKKDGYWVKEEEPTKHEVPV